MGTLQFGCFIVLFLLVIILMCVSDLIRYTVLYHKLYHKFGDDWRTSFSKAWKDFIQFMLGYDNKEQD